MNDWGIPEDAENRIRRRDRKCVYCHVRLMEKWKRGRPRKTVASWEHICNAKWNDPTFLLNVVRCCWSCNSSKGKKRLLKWFESSYCQGKRISEKSVGSPVKVFLKKHRKLA